MQLSVQRLRGCCNRRRVLAVAAVLLLAGCTVAAKTVHVVFGSHLDIGFNNIEPQIGWDHNVINKYLNEYYPRAVDVADEVARVSGDRFTYTTSCWLISLFLDCPTGLGLQCPDAATRAKVLRGIRQGAINWHAHPHKADLEVYDRSLLEFATDMTHQLDAAFGQPPKKTLLLRDVPGITRAAIPILVAKGVVAISVGVNQGSAPPGVPLFTPFIWRDEASGTQLIAFWRPGGYGGWYDRWQLILDPPEQCISAPGLDHVLCTSWRWDNSGPAPDAADPIKMFKVLREDWGVANSSSSSSSNDKSGAAAPASAAATAASAGGANVVVTSTFDAFVDAVLEALPRLNLTVVTGEIGDTWIHGVQSDPLKVADFRAASRARSACVASPACPSQIPQFHNFSRLLTKIAEHTQGVDVKKTLADFSNWTNADFYKCLPPQLLPKTAAGAAAAALEQPSRAQHEFVPGAGVGGRDPAPCDNYEANIVSWERQAAYVDWAIEALPPSHPVATEFAADRRVRKAMAAVSPNSLAAAGAKAAGVSTARRLAASLGGGDGAQDAGGVWAYTLGAWQLELDPEQGGITSLSKLHPSGRQGNDWAGHRGARAAPPSPPSTTSTSGNTFSDPALLGCAADGGAGVLGQLVYHAYSEASYDVIWNKYSWELPPPWWFPLDFGKTNSSQAWETEVQAVARLEEVFETQRADGELEQLALQYSMPDELVEKTGAPRTMWMVITGPSAPAGELDVAVVWQDKPPTRLPEALFFGFQPAAGAVDPASWRMHKLGSPISPLEVIVNGSQSLHAIGDDGVSVRSADGSELLQIKSFDAALVSPGWPTVFPIVATKPCMAGGMHFNLVNNVWGTNFPMWVPFSTDQVNLAFRFQLQASLLGSNDAPAA